MGSGLSWVCACSSILRSDAATSKAERSRAPRSAEVSCSCADVFCNAACVGRAGLAYVLGLRVEG